MCVCMYYTYTPTTDSVVDIYIYIYIYGTVIPIYVYMYIYRCMYVYPCEKYYTYIGTYTLHCCVYIHTYTHLYTYIHIYMHHEPPWQVCVRRLAPRRHRSRGRIACSNLEMLFSRSLGAIRPTSPPLARPVQPTTHYNIYIYICIPTPIILHTSCTYTCTHASMLTYTKIYTNTRLPACACV
jgi:hypothetical protein